MCRGKIIISDMGVISVEAGDRDIWMSYGEIEELFDIYDYSVKKNIKAIFKSGALWEYDVCQVRELPNCHLAEEYNLEMIFALAFRIHTRNAEILRKWIVKKMARQPINATVMLQISNVSS